MNTAQTHLYIAMTRSCEVWRIALRNDAIVGKAQCFARVPPGLAGPDGLAMDRHDRLYRPSLAWLRLLLILKACPCIACNPPMGA